MVRLPTQKPLLTALRPTLQAPKDEAGRSRYRDANAPHRAWYRTARWQKLRQVILLRDGFTCQMSGAPLRGGRSDKTGSILRPAVIDHLMPHNGQADLFWDPDNLWAISADMHDTVCQAIEAKLTGEAARAAKIAHRVVGIDGYPTRPAGRWIDQRWATG